MKRLLSAAGALLACLGPAASQATVHHHVISPVPDSNFGVGVAILGDWNGDGRDDFAIADNFDDTQGTDAGRVTVHSGPTGQVLRQYYGLPQDRLGSWISDAGDVNGDGFADLVIATSAFGAGNDEYVAVVGGPDGDLIGLVPSSQNDFGVCVAGAGDVNGDGFDDVIVGSRGDSTNGTQAGAAFVYSGSFWANGTGPLVLRSLFGASAGDQFGWRVDGGGDVDGDGTPDVLVSAVSELCSSPGGGVVRVYSGATWSVIHAVQSAGCDVFGQAAAIVGDADLDGYDDFAVGASGGAGRVVVYSGRTGLVLHDLPGESPGDSLGHSVERAGDANGDGYADIVAGAYFADPGGASSGRAYIVSGRNGQELARLNGLGPQDLLGGRVAGGGDVDGDGLDDVIAGAHGSGSHPPAEHGYAFVFGPSCAEFMRQYCDSTANSTGQNAYLLAVGSPVHADNDVRLVARLCPPGQLGLFLYGPNRAFVPFGNGFRCLAPILRIYPAQVVDGTGTAARQLDLFAPPFDAGPGQIHPGSTWNFQFWFRDPAAGGALFNATSAVEVRFCP